MAKSSNNNELFHLVPLAAIIGGFLLLKRRDKKNNEVEQPDDNPELGRVPTRGMGTGFVKRRAYALVDLYESQLAMEVKPMSYDAVERRAYYDKEKDTFRLEGNSYDYTSKGK